MELPARSLDAAPLIQSAVAVQSRSPYHPIASLSFGLVESPVGSSHQILGCFRTAECCGSYAKTRCNYLHGTLRTAERVLPHRSSPLFLSGYSLTGRARPTDNSGPSSRIAKSDGARAGAKRKVPPINPTYGANGDRIASARLIHSSAIRRS